MEQKTYTADFKARAVLESLQRDTTLEAVCQKFGVSRSQLSRWRQEFQAKVPGLFVDKRNPKEKAISQGYEPGESPDDLKKIIGELTVQNEILKKASRLPGGKEDRANWSKWLTSCVYPTARIQKARSPVPWAEAEPRSTGLPNKR